MSALLNSGNGTLGPRAGYNTGAGPMFVAAGDLDGDGRNDLATANHLSGDVSVLINRCVP